MVACGQSTRATFSIRQWVQSGGGGGVGEWGITWLNKVEIHKEGFKKVR